MLRGMSQRLSDGERSWEADKRGLEGQLSRTLHSLREFQATADQLRSASQHALCQFRVCSQQLGCPYAACLPLCSLTTLVHYPGASYVLIGSAFCF